MGTRARQKQERLAEKLLQIRLALGLSQNRMIRHLGIKIGQNTISEYELGKREPSLRILLLYARAVNISTDILIDDELDLPDKLPSNPKHKR